MHVCFLFMIKHIKFVLMFRFPNFPQINNGKSGGLNSFLSVLVKPSLTIAC